MDRVRDLVIRAFPKLPAEHRERLMVDHFVGALADSSVAQNIASHHRQSPSEAVRTASAVGLHSKSGRRYASALREPDNTSYAAVAQNMPDDRSDAYANRNASVQAVYSLSEYDPECFVASPGSLPGRGCCYRCGKPGHFASKCYSNPTDSNNSNRSNSAQATGNRLADPSASSSTCYSGYSKPFECFGCGSTDHSVAQCPHVAKLRAGFVSEYNRPVTSNSTTAGSTSQASYRKKPSGNEMPVGNNSSKAVAYLAEDPVSGSSHVNVLLQGTSDPADSEELDELILPIADTDDMVRTLPKPVNQRRDLFFVPGQLQDKWVWLLIDSGSCRNLVSEGFWNSLSFKPKLGSPGSDKVVAGNGATINVLGEAPLLVVLEGVRMWHNFAVVRGLPLDILIGGELLEPHRCRLTYQADGRKRVEVFDTACAACHRNLNFMRERGDPQLALPPKTPYKRRLRFRNFAMLPVLEDSMQPSKNSLAGLTASRTMN